MTKKLNKIKNQVIDLNEYKIEIHYQSNNSELNINVFDELNQHIEGIYISNEVNG